MGVADALGGEPGQLQLHQGFHQVQGRRCRYARAALGLLAACSRDRADDPVHQTRRRPRAEQRQSRSLTAWLSSSLDLSQFAASLSTSFLVRILRRLLKCRH